MDTSELANLEDNYLKQEPFSGENAIFKAIRILFHRRKLAVSVFAGCLVATVLLTVLLPRQYVSHLKVLVKNERANSLINLGNQTQGLLYLNDVSEARINTEIELLNSSDLLKEVVQKAGLEKLVGSSEKNSDKRKEIALNDLRKALTVAAAHRSDVIEVTYHSKDPKLSASVLKILSEVYLQKHLELHGAPGSFEFFDGMWRTTSKQLSDADNAIEQFAQSFQIVSLPEEKTLILKHLTDLKRSLIDTEGAADKDARMAASYREAIDHTSPSVEKERKLIPNQAAIEQLNTLLVTLKNKRTEATSRYQPGDRIITELDKQISVTQNAIDQMNKAPSQEVANGINPVYQDSESNLVQAKAAYSGNLAAGDNLRKEVGLAEKRLAQLSSITASYDQLVRQRDDLIHLQEIYRKNRDEAYIAQLLDKQKLANVAIVETPAPEHITSLPRRSLILLVGLIWSFIAAGITAAIVEHFNPKIYSLNDLESALPVPLLAAIPPRTPFVEIGDSFPELYLAMQRTIYLSTQESL